MLCKKCENIKSLMDTISVDCPLAFAICNDCLNRKSHIQVVDIDKTAIEIANTISCSGASVGMVDRILERTKEIISAQLVERVPTD